MGYSPPYLFVRKAAATQTNVYGNTETLHSLYIYANQVDDAPRIALIPNYAYEILCNMENAGAKFRINTGADGVLTIGISGTDTVFDTIANNKNIFLQPHGTGNVKFGTYAAAIATESTGYITIKDAAGNSRKLMVQA